MTTHHLAGIEVRAVSVGGLETCIELPQWKLCFDVGRCPPTAAKLPRVLFTHGHIDHLGGIATHATLRDLWGMSPPEYYVPAENFEDVATLLATWRRLDRSEIPCRLHAAKPGDSFDLGGGRAARPFRAVHRVPTLGWALTHRRERLKPEFAALSPAEVGQLRRGGAEVVDATEEIAVAFCGDTVIDVVRHPEVRQAKLLILECTFLDERVAVAKARRTGHVHLDELIAHADAFENEAILLTHFSARYEAAEISAILEKRLPATLRDRVTALLPTPPWAP